MSLGQSQWSAVAGGGQQRANAAQLVRYLVQFGVCTAAPPNALIQPGDQASLLAQAGLGPLAEALAFRQRQGLPTYGVAITPSQAGALSAASAVSSGTGNATVGLTLAPHVAVLVKCVTGGALGTAAFQFSLDGGATWSATVTSSAASPPWTQRVLGTFCTVSFPVATYVVNTTATIGVTGTVTLNSGWVGAITQTSSPTDPFEGVITIPNGGGFGTAMMRVSLDGGSGATGGGATLPDLIIPTNGVIVLPNTGIVLTVGQHTIVITMTTPGALGTAIYSYAVDGGTTVTGQTTTPNSGSNYVVTIPGTGVTLTFAPGTYVSSSTYTVSSLGVIALGGGAINTVTQVWAGPLVTDSFSFLSAPPGYSTSDLNAALTAFAAMKNVPVAAVHIVGMPSSAAAAVTQQAALEAAIDTAVNNGLDWQGWCECPHASGSMGLGDIVVSGGFAIRDTADTDAVVQAARGADTNRVGLHACAYRITSPITKRNHARPLGWLVADRFVDTDPDQDISAPQPFGPLRAFIPPGSTTIGRDESATPGLDSYQINAARTYGTQSGIYLDITSGGAGWKNTTVQATWQDAGFLRIVNNMIAQLRPVVANLLAQRPPTNPDGTIDEDIRLAWSTMIDTAWKQSCGLMTGGPYTRRQASFASASVSAASQLGQSPKQLIITYLVQSLGFVSSIQNNAYFSGTLVVSA